MGRKSTRPTFATVTDALRAMTDNADPARMTEWGRSGNERAHLVSLMHEDSPECAFCGLDTFHTMHKGAATAVLALLVPASSIPGSDGRRVGYVGGNMVLGCMACTDARGTYVKSTGERLPVTPDEVERAEAWLTLPTLDRTYRIAPEDGKRLGYVARAAETHREEAREARRERGLPY